MAELRFWICTWNLGAAEPYPARGRAPRDLGWFVPDGYDLYCLNVQEAASEDLFDAFEQRLSMQGLIRLNLSGRAVDQYGRVLAGAAPRDGSNSADTKVEDEAQGRPDLIYGHGDGSILSSKFTGLAIYVREDLLSAEAGPPRVAVCRVNSHACTHLTSKGGAAAVLLVDGRTVVFVSTHLAAANRFEERRAQYRDICAGLGDKLGESSFDLCEQFGHVFWSGDLNYRCVQGGGKGERDKGIVAEVSLTFLEKGQSRKMFQQYDQLSIEMGRREVFFDFMEPKMVEDFYPTYKKHENRKRLDYADPAWVRQCYHTAYREPFYKGGRVKERTPGWCDRVLVHSLHDLQDEVRPETVAADAIPSQESLKTLRQRKWMQRERAGASIAVAAPGAAEDEETEDGAMHEEMVQNYFAVNEGPGSSVSDHSPVVASFTFRSRLYRDPATLPEIELTSAPASPAAPPKPLKPAKTGSTDSIEPVPRPPPLPARSSSSVADTSMDGDADEQVDFGEISGKSSEEGHKVVWQCQTDDGWAAFEDEICNKIEAAFGPKMEVTFKTKHEFKGIMGRTVSSDLNTYRIDWASLEQVNVKTNKRRAIRRLGDSSPTSPDRRSVGARGGGADNYVLGDTIRDFDAAFNHTGEGSTMASTVNTDVLLKHQKTLRRVRAARSIRLDNFMVMRGTSEVQPEALAMVFPAPFEDMGPQLNVAGSSSVVSASLQANPMPTRASLDKSGKKNRRRTSSAVDQLPKEQSMEWSFTSAGTGGLKSTLNLLDPGLYTYEGMPTAKLCWMGEQDLAKLHLVVQVKLAEGELGHCIVPLVRLVAAASTNALNGEGEKAALSTSERFVEPLMFEGLPLKFEDASTGESELVTAFFALSLVDEEAEADEADEAFVDDPGFRFSLGHHPSADSKRWWRQKSREAGFVEETAKHKTGIDGEWKSEGAEGSPVVNRTRGASGSYGEIEV